MHRRAVDPIPVVVEHESAVKGAPHAHHPAVHGRSRLGTPPVATVVAMRRLAVVLSVAVPLAAADLWVKAVEPTAPWAYHQRSGSWLLLSLALLAATIVVTRIPSSAVPPAAGVLAGGLLGNTLSAVWNGMAVPNPLVVNGEQSIVAFNLADVWALVGIFLLMASIGVWLIGNRELIPTTAQARAALRKVRQRA
jgi:hypothetical protein